MNGVKLLKNNFHKVFLKVLLLFIFITVPLYSLAQKKEDTLNVKKKLIQLGIRLYPEVEELKNCKLKKEWFKTETISPEDVNESFSNFDDLSWLEPISHNVKVFLQGENHYYQVTHHLRNRILFALNTFDRFSLVLIEQEYSISGYLDYYTGIKDDNEAENFYQNVIYDFVNTEELYELLEHLRKWNKIYPEKRIHIGAHDIEHNYKLTIEKIIVPYFRLIDSTFSINVNEISIFDSENLIKKLKGLLNKAKDKNLIGAYPFLTPRYIENVIENLNSYFKSYMYDFNYYRQKAIVRNMTDPRFFGRFFTEGKVMIHEGAYHSINQFPFPDGGNFLREGNYLTFEFEPTKSKTFSIYVRGLTYKIGSMAGINLNSYLRQGSNYNRIINKFKNAYRKKLVTPENYYFFEPLLDQYDKLIFTLAYENNNLPFLIKNIDWDLVLKESKKISNSIYNLIRKVKNELNRYDALIFVPRSQIVYAKRKR
ncbi:hypothetical protein DRQ09_04655 [candidate division KSB1 bacterium]|nr:MAG: hypothetical protein DRQ09_04655 [candidate division KSB1 bacterium]